MQAQGLDLLQQLLKYVLLFTENLEIFNLKYRKMKTLLVILNDPQRSKTFMRYSLEMANDFDASLHYLYVQNNDAYPLGVDGATGIASVEVIKTLEEKAYRVRKWVTQFIREIDDPVLRDLPFEFSSRIGSRKTFIDEIVADGKADMIVLENPEDHNFWFEGSSNMEIIKDAGVPVWIIPSNARYETFHKIIYATDFNQEDPDTIRRLIHINQFSSPDITALHVTDSLDFDEKIKEAGFLDTLKEKTHYKKLSVQSIREEGHDELPDKINAYAHLVRADLIVVLRENRNFLERIFRASDTKKIVKEAELPVLVYHEKES